MPVPSTVAGIVCMHEQFRKFARRSAEIVGSAEVFLTACIIIVLWAAFGPRFRFSDTWQLVINTTTTIVTFLMVFLIQNTQNRDARAIQLKLDELIRAVQGARTGMVRLEELTVLPRSRVSSARTLRMSEYPFSSGISLLRTRCARSRNATRSC